MPFPSRYTAADIRASYDDAKSAEELAGEWFSYVVYRPLSYPLAAWLLNRGVSANRVTLASLLLALSLPLQALAGDHAYLALGLSGLLFGTLDCVDGNIARASGSSSRLGQYGDFATDVGYRIAMYSALGVVVARGPEPPTGVLAWLLGALLLALFARLCRYYYEYRLDQGSVTPTDTSHHRGIGDWAVTLLSGVDSALPLLVLAAGAAGVLPWVVAWLVAYSLGDLLYTQYSILRRLG